MSAPKAVADQTPVEIAALTLTDGHLLSDYVARADSTFAIYVQLGSTFGMDPKIIQIEARTQQLPAYHPEHPDTWVTFARGPSGDAVIQRLMGDGVAVLTNDYANIRMLLGFLFFGIAGQGDFVLHAVRPQENARGKWLQVGSPVIDDSTVLEVDLARCSPELLRHHMSRNELLDTWWKPVGNAKGQQHTCITQSQLLIPFPCLHSYSTDSSQGS